MVLVHRKSNQSFAESLQHAAIWTTCLRKILFCSENELHGYQDYLEPEDQIFHDEQSLAVLLEILCGLHSPIVGETEVFGQFKAFIDTRKSLNDPLFLDSQKWLHFITAEVKKTRSEHLAGIGAQSYGSLLRRHTKNFDTLTLCGSGQLAKEILPWLTHKTCLQIICRKPANMEVFAKKYDHLTLSTYDTMQIHGTAMIIAAPISDACILKIIHKQQNTQKPAYRSHPFAVFDLRGQTNALPQLVGTQFPGVKVIALQQFFSEIEETKKATQIKLQAIRAHLLEKAQAFTQRIELRPLGWEDLCA